MDIKFRLQLLEWTDARKCLAISLIAVVFSFFYLMFLLYLDSREELLPQINRSFITLGITILPPVLLSWIVISTWAFLVVKKKKEQVALVYITLLWYGIPNAFLVYSLGPVTNPFVGIALLGTAIISVMLFRIKPALITFSAVILLMVVLTILERMQMIPYAPLLEIEPTVDGRPGDLWVASFGSISLLMIVAVVAAFVYIIYQLRQRETELELLSNTDSLTGLNNRRRFMEIAKQEFFRAQRSGRALAIIMCDADHFKQVNDTWGHQMGDEVLRKIADTILDNSRVATDFVGRIGGEEFAMVSAETDEQAAKKLTERILDAMRNYQFEVEGETFNVTLSMGLVMLDKEFSSVEEMMHLADQRLYRAKEAGRDQLVAG